MSELVSTARPTARRGQRSWLQSFQTLLQTELSPYPGRLLLTLRIVMACTIVMFCIAVFRIPGSVLGAYTPILISRDNLHATRRSALWVAGACTTGAIEVILGAMLSVGSPPLHLIWIWGSLFGVFYLVSILRVYEAALALGMFITNTISIWDQPHSSDLRVRQTLFMLLAILLGCAATVVIEYLFARTHPPDAVIEGIEERLKLAEKVLEQYATGHSKWQTLRHTLHRYSARGTAALRLFVEQSGYTMEDQQRLSIAVAIAGRLIDLSMSLIDEGHGCSVADRQRSLAIRNDLARFRHSLVDSQPIDWQSYEDSSSPCTPVLAEIERSVALLKESSSPALWNQDAQPGQARHNAAETRQGVFVADAFSSGSHVKFALRGALSAIACYMFFMSVGWIGLNASIATCVLTALPVTGAARHKQLMRFAGVVLGACALGFTAQVIILPQIDSILSYVLLFACVAFLGAWISVSSPRIAYCGAQIVLAYEVVSLSRFSINPSLIPARDTVLGILLGVFAMWLIFDHLWATSSTESIRPLLGATIHQIANLSLSPDAYNHPSHDSLLDRQTDAILKSLARIWTLADVSLFEAFPKTTEEEATVRHVSGYLPQLRTALLIKTGLLHHRLISGATRKSTVAQEADDLCAQLLHEVAERFETGKIIPQDLLNARGEQVEERLRSEIESLQKDKRRDQLVELRLSASLLIISRRLANLT